jgi:hypothetical protein
MGNWHHHLECLRGNRLIIVKVEHEYNTRQDSEPRLSGSSPDLARCHSGILNAPPCL